MLGNPLQLTKEYAIVMAVGTVANFRCSVQVPTARPLHCNNTTS